MEFWGVEIAPGKPLTCKPGDGFYVHVSQAALGESKSEKGNERVMLKVTVGKTEVVVGTLSHGKCDQIQLDLIFDQDFKISHTSATSSVYFSGYKTDSNDGFDSDMEPSEDESDEEEIPKAVAITAAKENGKAGGKEAKAKVEVPKEEPKKVEAKKADAKKEESKMKPKGGAKVVEDESDDDDEEDEDDSDDLDDDSDDEMGEDEDDLDDSEDDDDEEDDSEDDDEETPKAGKKRPPVSESKTASTKKMKIQTPSPAPKSGKKLDAKTPSTPAPVTPKSSKKESASAKKTPGKDNAKSSKEGSKTPGSTAKPGQFFCEPCKRNFTGEDGFKQHNTAKHGK